MDQLTGILVEGERPPLGWLLIDHGSRRVLVHGGERLIVTVGLEDVIIVDTPDALLVCSRDRAEEIKPVLDEIARTAGDRYL